MKTALLQPPFMPWLGALNQIASVDVFYLGDSFQFSKGAWVNRNRILNRKNNSPEWITVPVKKKDITKKSIKDVEIDNSINWRIKHLDLLRRNYSDTAFYKEEIKWIEEIYNKNHEKITDLNYEIINVLLKRLGIKTELKWLSEIKPEGKRNELLIDFCKKTNTDIYLTGVAAKEYIQEDLFKSNNIDLIYQDYHHPEYTQFGNDFVSHLSFLDALFIHGPNTVSKLIQSK